MSVGIQPSFNKFAFLNVQDSDSDSQSDLCHVKQKNKTAGKNTAVNNAKKRMRRRKKKESTVVDGKNPGAAASDNHSRSLGSHSHVSNKSNDCVKRDEDLVEQVFHDDMWKAIELSKQEYEREIQEVGNTAPLQDVLLTTSHTTNSSKVEPDVDVSLKKTERDMRREKKHKEKAAKTVSLEQFHQQVEDTLSLKSDPVSEEKQSLVSKTYKPQTKTTASGDFFDDIDKELTRIQHKSHLKDHKPAANTPEGMESMFVNERLSEQLLQKDKEIHELSDEMKSWKDKYHHVKKRNQQLLVMLQQGEMKDKAEILLEVERLSIIRDELTNEVTELHQSLEKERSKVSKLKDELKVASKSVRRQSEG